LNSLSGRKMSERYGARVGKAEFSRGFQEERENARVERTRIGRGFGKQLQDRGTSSESLGVLNCEGLSEFNLHSAVSPCVAILSCVAIPYCVGICSCCGICFCVGISSCIGSSSVNVIKSLFVCFYKTCRHRYSQLLIGWY